jgi:hypothetical protein
MVPDLATFVRNLSWTPALVDGCRSWLHAYQRVLERQFRAFCGRKCDLGWMVDAFQQLPETLQKDYLTAPRVACELLTQDVLEPNFSILSNELVRVLARPGYRTGSDPEVDALLRPFGRDYGDVQGIPLDFDSAFPIPCRPEDAGHLGPLAAARVPEVKRCLEAALEALRQGKPVALECVRLVTLRLLVRDEEPSRPDHFSSGSFGRYIGLSLLTNLWAEQVDAARLLDALVHESIHAALFIYEAVAAPLVLDRVKAEGLLSRSPWSGRMLGCNQFVQACFVWYGLAQLWNKWPDGIPGVPAARSRELYRRASQGFHARPVEMLASQPGWALVAPAVQDALRLLEREALAAFGPGPAVG